MSNPAYLIDAYKIDHRRMYPKGTTRVYSNFTPRDSRVDGVEEVVFFGLQAFLQETLEESFGEWFELPENEVCEEYERRTNAVLGPNTVGSEHIRALHRLGYLPLRFNALPEGTRVPLRVPMFTVENTDPEFFWLTNYIESVLSNALWQSCTSATIALRMRQLCDRWAEQTAPHAKAFVDWQGHDFSFRGMSSIDSAKASGAAHLLSFAGTDTMPALDWVEKFYDGEGFLGGSVPATEHSVMCAGGKETETETFSRLLDLYPSGIVSVVSDTWDLWKVLTETLYELKDRILSREGKLVVRPDSGNPADILCGSLSAPEGTPEHKGVVELLWDCFGGTTNECGYRELDPHIGCIYGDSITYERAEEIFERLAEKGFASTNVVFGIGSYTYQHQTRDVFGMAMKATWVEIDGQGVDIFKAPVTDNGVKKSARGRLAVLLGEDGELKLVECATPEQEAQSQLVPVWEDGRSVQRHTWSEVVERVGVRHL